MKTIQERARENGFSVDEQKAIDEVAEHLSSYMRNRVQHYRTGLSLTSFILSTLLDSGALPGIEYARDTIALHRPFLASALAKLESQLPAMPSSPLEAIV